MPLDKRVTVGSLSTEAGRSLNETVGLRDSVVASKDGASGWSGLMYGQPDTQFDALQTKLDGGLKLRRFYEPTWPSAPTSKENTDFARGIIPWVSFKFPNADTINSGSHDSILAAYWGASDKKKLVTWVHEVDTGSKPSEQGGYANWKTAWGRIMDIKRANCPNNSEVLFGPILTGYAFSPFASDNYRNWLLPGKMDFIGTDPYNFWRPRYSPTTTDLAPWTDPKCGGGNCVDRSFEWWMGSSYAWTTTNMPGIPWAVGEYACHPDPNNTAKRPNWLQDAHDYMLGHNFIAAALFSTQYGESGPWFVDRFHTFSPSENDAVRLNGPDDPATITKLKALIASVS